MPDPEDTTTPEAAPAAEPTTTHSDTLVHAVERLPDPPAEPEPEPWQPTPFLVTKEHRRFVEFADACRRHRYIGLCHGPPGVGKTLSARHLAHWDEVEPFLRRWRRHPSQGRERTDWHTVFYTPTMHASPRVIDKDLQELSQRLAFLRATDPFALDNHQPHGSGLFTELLIIDEADRLKMPSLEQLRDHYDRSQLGLILIGMPGIEKRLAPLPAAL